MLFRSELSISQREWTHLSEDGVKDSMSFDFEKNWDLVLESIKESISKSKVDPKDIVALSSSSMREGIVLYDKDKNPIWAVANVDARAYKEVGYLKEHFEGIEEEFYQISGQTFALGALPRLLWLKNNKKELYDKTAYISMISDWILFKLSGVIGVDPSNGGTTGIFSLKDRDWHKQMAKRVGIKDDIFPPVFESGEILGVVSKEASDESGLSQDTKVVMGGGDVQMGAVGLGVVNEGEAAILGGSFWQQVVNIKKDTLPPKDMSIRINPHIPKDLSQAEAITFFSGLIMRWFRDAFCDLEKEEAKRRGIDVYQILEEKAKDVPIGSYGIVPIFSDSMKYGKWYHASPSFINLSIDPNICNKASMFRSLQENAAIVSAVNLQKIEQFTDIDIDELIFAAGASKSEIWSQIVADATGKRVKVPLVKEATSLGVAMVCMVALGVYDSLDDAIKNVVKIERVFEPNMKNHQLYIDLIKRWESIYEVQLSLVDKGVCESMWKAPGV